jgi:hypothetical protein
MQPSNVRHPSLFVVAALAVVMSGLQAQDLPPSGTSGLDLVYGTSPSGSSALFAISLTAPGGPAAIMVGDPVSTPPSRWVHRRRTLGALETGIAYIDAGLAITPMGDGPGTGALHLVDARAGLDTALVMTGNPASYDLAVSESLRLVLVVEDDEANGTLVRGFSWETVGTLTPLNPPTLALPGKPCAHVTEIGLDANGTRCHIPTSTGIAIVDLAVASPQMSLVRLVDTSPSVPATNVASFSRGGASTWVVGTSTFNALGGPVEAGFFSWDADGMNVESGTWGTIPVLTPPRSYVPAAGTTELAIVGDGTDTWVYYLLRDPSPTAFFIRPSAVGVVRFLGAAAPVVSTILYPPEGGEPFAIPTVNGTRVAIESSQGPPFNSTPPDGGEPVSILYSPLDPLGAGSADGILAVPSPLGGRISTKGMDRPLWTRDGTRIVAATSHFPGAPNPGAPGIEVLNVPETIPLILANAPHYVVANFIAPYRSIVFPSSFDPRDPTAATFLDGFSFVGNVFHNGMASIMVTPFGEIGQFNERTTPFVQSVNIPNFPAVHPPLFDDAAGSLVPVPPTFGARRTTWNLYPGVGFVGLALSAAIDDRILIQPSGINFFIQVGILPGPAIDPIEVPLPAGWITSTEFLSL